MQDPQPIESAPRDGTVVLTDCGPALYLDQKQWGSPVWHGSWVNCTPDGYPFKCADEGDWYCHPKLWVPMPEWIRG